MGKNFYDKKTKEELSKTILQELNEDPYYKFKLVFALMGIIPLLSFAYIIFYVLAGSNLSLARISLILYILVFIVFLAFLLGYQTIKKLLGKIIFYAAEMKRSEQLQADLVASISHDFEIPIKLLKELISNVIDKTHGPLNEVQAQRLNSCQLTLGDMHKTMSTLLDLYKVECGLVGLKKEPVNLYELIEDRVKTFEHSFKNKGVNINLDISRNSPIVNIDKEKIKEVIGNLFSNFLKYTPDNGWVNLRLFSSTDFIRFELSNNSETIPFDQLGAIFDKFEKLHKNAEGTGLGLAIARSIVQAHGGKIWAENLPGKGVKFILLLPNT
ncbi:MAG: HAMP domain-containing histidine kinase [Candidatus Omnitrophica bacterium]|nr:HAMP domain-containing histidine kinase [Candidatus Omnitrophota bacterium]